MQDPEEFDFEPVDEFRELRGESLLQSTLEKIGITLLEHAQGSIEEWLEKGNLEKALSQFGKALLSGKVDPKSKPAGPVGSAVRKRVKTFLNHALVNTTAIHQQLEEMKHLPQVKTVKQLAQLNPRQFELWTAHYLQTMGYRKVTVTSYSGDFGVDVYAENRQGKKLVVQCKHYHAAVGTPVIQQTMGALWFSEADICCVAVTGHFSQNVLDLAAKYRDVILLLDGERMVNDLAKKKIPAAPGKAGSGKRTAAKIGGKTGGA